MSSILATVLPVFGLIMLGFICAKLRLFDPAAARGLSQFVFNIAIPAFLFRTVASMSAQDVEPWGLWLAFFSSIAVIWLATYAVSRVVPSLGAENGSAASMAASFGNLVMLGTPLTIAHFGNASAAPIGMILSVHAPILWFVATIHREFFRSGAHHSIIALVSDLILSLAKNAIVIALISGSLWRLTGWAIPSIPDEMLRLLSEASVPTSLFALGLSLAGYSLRGQFGAMGILIGLKMLGLPLVVWLMVTYVIPLPPIWSQVAVLLAAIPTGANAFLFATRYDAAVPAVSGAVALGTMLAAITVPILLYFLDG